ncbi:hypothetical protein B0H16DRAFT_1883696 [Mycena metata]|uniref:Uncharacterized protein n=1 Tax=Mycena metata TaxID=1033252 RepID=A0AAD7JEM5_9AGAR|nr:hypothetical protein B0H16DRAFT_1883696 [Mycena metata]
MAFNLKSWSGWESLANASRAAGEGANWGVQAVAGGLCLLPEGVLEHNLALALVLSDGVCRGAQVVREATPSAVKEKLEQAGRNAKDTAGFVGGQVQRGGEAAVVGLRRAAQFVEDTTPPVVREKIGDAAEAARRGVQAIDDATPPAVKQKLGEAAAFIETLPAPVKYGALAATGAAVLAAPLAPAILGGVYGIGAAGPVAGGTFAGIQAGGAVVAGSSWAVIQSIAMGGALPAVGVLGASAIGGAVGAAGGAVASHVSGATAGSDSGGPGGGPRADDRDDVGAEERAEIEEEEGVDSTLPGTAEKSKL